MRYIYILIIILGWSSLSLYGSEKNESPQDNESKELGSGIDLIVELERTFKYISPTEVWVNVKVRKQGVNGFARFVDSFSVGYTVGEVNAVDGTVISEKGKLKIIWMKLPDNEDLKISYKLKGKDLFLHGCMVEGRFSYLTNGQPIQIDLAPLFYYGREEGFDNGTGDYYSAIWRSNDAKEDTENDSIPLGEKKQLIDNLRQKLEEAENLERTNFEEIDGVVMMEDDEGDKAHTAKAEDKKYEDINSEEEIEEEVKEVINDIKGEEEPKKENEVVEELKYSIQITVVKYALPDNYFENKYGLEYPVEVDMRGERFAYVIGSFSNFQEAKEFKESNISPKLPGSFIIAYINNEVVSIQKALNFESK